MRETDLINIMERLERVEKRVGFQERLESVSSGLVGAKVYRTSNQTINATSWEDINFDNEEWDTDTIHDNATNNEQLTCKTAGKYLVIAYFRGSATLDYGAIFKNNTSYEVLCSVAVQGSIGSCSIVSEMDLAVNDYLTFRAYNPSGGGVDVTVTDGKPFFSMRKIG